MNTSGRSVLRRKAVFCVRAKRFETDRKIGEELDRQCGLWRICNPNVSDDGVAEHCTYIAKLFQILDV